MGVQGVLVPTGHLRLQGGSQGSADALLWACFYPPPASSRAQTTAKTVPSLAREGDLIFNI